MSELGRLRAWVLVGLLSTGSGLLAQEVNSGPVSFLFSSATAPVYDLTGTYRFDQPVVSRSGDKRKLSFVVALRQDAVGRLQGSGSTTLRLGSDDYDATYALSGRVSGGGIAGTRVAFVVRLLGAGATGSAAAPLDISVQYHLQASPAGLNGTVRGRARMGGLGTGAIQSFINGVPLPAGIDGSWGVEMNPGALSGSTGTGSILLPNGRSVEGRVTGDYSAASTRGRVTLSGESQDRGNTLKMSFLPQTQALKKVHGRILGQIVSGAVTPSQFAGSHACSECHGPVYQSQQATFHGEPGPDGKPRAQCENCHGPAQAHVANDYDPLTRPTVDFNGTACGVCHSGPQQPVYEEWSLSGHAQVVEETTATNLTLRCGQCHSGAVRVSLLDGLLLPPDAGNVPIGCASCHETHQDPTNSFLLRNPLSSTNDYFLPGDALITTNYDASVNLCAQCHNDRGATWTVSSRPPHQSLQYNMLLGTVGELDSGLPPYRPASHALMITNQCVGCHMQTAPYQSPAQPAVTGHQFTVNAYNLCYDCHPYPDLLLEFTSGAVSNQIQSVKFGLDLWATTKAPALLSAKYGTRAWEYTIPGELSPGGPGPDAAEQALIPDNIKKARFNMYLVLYDGSYGAHNGPYAVSLLDSAYNWVQAELNN